MLAKSARDVKSQSTDAQLFFVVSPLFSDYAAFSFTTEHAPCIVTGSLLQGSLKLLF